MRKGSALLPVKSNYSVPVRDALLRRLADDLLGPFTDHSTEPRILERRQLIADAAAELNGRGAIVLLGLEETPGIVRPSARRVAPRSLWLC